MTPAPHIIAIHGINTSLVNPAWPWSFAAYVDQTTIQARVETEHYKAGPYPRLNTLFVNPKLAKALANRVLLRRQLLGAAPVHIVAHSNGCVIAIDVAKRLAKSGLPVETLVLIAAAAHSDVRKNGLMELSASHMLGRAVAYMSPDDNVIKPLQTFPGAYGSLGARGWQLERLRYGVEVDGYSLSAPPFSSFLTRRCDGFGHGDYFAPQWATQTYSTALTDMGLFPEY